MDIATYALILASAGAHAGWNFAAKKSTADKVALICLAQLAVGLTLVPAVAAFWGPSALGNLLSPYVLATGAIHAAYALLLGRAYERGALSVVYPIARGTGVAGTAALGVTLGFESLSALGAWSVVSVCGGVLLIGLRQNMKSSVVPGLLVGASIVSYTLVDKFGANRVPPFQYLAFMNLVAAVFLLPIVSRKRMIGPTIRHWKSVVTVGFVSAGTYLVILWAFQRSPASYVVALRETSVLFASALGVFVLHEPLTRSKILGSVLVTAGIVGVKLA